MGWDKLSKEDALASLDRVKRKQNMIACFECNRGCITLMWVPSADTFEVSWYFAEPRELGEPVSFDTLEKALDFFNQKLERQTVLGISLPSSE